MNSEKVEIWHGIIISPTEHVLKSWTGYGKNWMHFVYNMDNLFRSIRVSDKNSSITKGFHFLKHILTQDFFCIHKATYSLFNPFLTSFAIWHAFQDLFWAKMILKLKSTANELWNDWKLAWYHNFTHIACAKNLNGLREKLDALRVQYGQSLSKYQGFGRKLVYYKGI